MSFTSLMFFVFLLIGALIYYVLPKKIQWAWLLIMSYAYYFTFSVKTSVFMIATTVIVYAGGRMLGRINADSSQYLAVHKENLDREAKKQYKNKVKKKKRSVVALVLILVFGILAVVKYYNFVFGNVNRLLADTGHESLFPMLMLALPIGISFYTFQSASYIIDIYQGKYECERNILKFALFVSFFPQLMQGPIGRFDRLSKQFYEGRSFDLKRIQFGLQRIGWGIFKKVVLADRTAPLVAQVFNNYQIYGGFYNIMAVLMYSVQLYMDFSGGIDIVIGAAEIFGIKIDENFRQPYFSKSIGEFWRRWHITLGAWMKDYIFYPLSLSSGMHKFGKWSKKHFGNTFGKTLPICFANILIFFIVGIWHGAAWKYIFYGLYNGFIIAISNLLEPLYSKAFEKTGIKNNSRPWKAFQIVRTFILVNIGWYFDMAVSARAAFSMMKHTVTECHLSQLTDGSMLGLGMSLKDYAVVISGCIVVLIVSILKERNVKIRESIAAKPIVIRWTIYYGVILAILLLG
ncbi:MAG: MBOAT family O-acyltransferase, partial [Eubacteriales bacterium]|nr:MBOAT family O-acyltransferase [Eubacteriales bacterium]